MRKPIEDKWQSNLWANNPELLEYTAKLETRLEEAVELIRMLVYQKYSGISEYTAHIRGKAFLNTLDQEKEKSDA